MSGSIAALAKRLKETTLDVLINNAGIYSGTTTHEKGDFDDVSQTFGTIDGEAWLRVLRINTIGPLLVAQAFVPHLQRGKDKKIINITSKMGALSEMGGGFHRLSQQ